MPAHNTIDFDIDRAKKIYDKEGSFKCVAQQMGCSIFTVHQRFKAAGVPCKHPRKRDNGTKAFKRGADYAAWYGKTKIRMGCLKCDKQFPSRSKTNNRICRVCKTENGRIYQTSGTVISRKDAWV